MLATIFLAALATSVVGVVVNEAAERAQLWAATGLFLGGVAITTSLVGGWLGAELGSDVALLWLQVKGSLWRLSLSRFAASVALSVGLVLVLAGGSVVLLEGWATGAGIPLLKRVPGLVAALLSLSALIWASGAWGVRGDGTAGLLLATTLAGLELLARLGPGLLGPLVLPADLVGLPVDELGQIARAAAAQTPLRSKAVAALLVWWFGWIAVGIAGVLRTERNRIQSL